MNRNDRPDCVTLTRDQPHRAYHPGDSPLMPMTDRGTSDFSHILAVVLPLASRTITWLSLLPGGVPFSWLVQMIAGGERRHCETAG
jgi:hypothetical protein